MSSQYRPSWRQPGGIDRGNTSVASVAAGELRWRWWSIQWQRDKAGAVMSGGRRERQQGWAAVEPVDQLQCDADRASQRECHGLGRTRSRRPHVFACPECCSQTSCRRCS